jgi:hypothetical protein
MNTTDTTAAKPDRVRKPKAVKADSAASPQGEAAAPAEPKPPRVTKKQRVHDMLAAGPTTLVQIATSLDVTPIAARALIGDVKRMNGGTAVDYDAASASYRLALALAT